MANNVIKITNMEKEIRSKQSIKSERDENVHFNQINFFLLKDKYYG